MASRERLAKKALNEVNERIKEKGSDLFTVQDYERGFLTDKSRSNNEGENEIGRRIGHYSLLQAFENQEDAAAILVERVKRTHGKYGLDQNLKVRREAVKALAHSLIFGEAGEHEETLLKSLEQHALNADEQTANFARDALARFYSERGHGFSRLKPSIATASSQRERERRAKEAREHVKNAIEMGVVDLRGSTGARRKPKLPEKFKLKKPLFKLPGPKDFSHRPGRRRK
jgi:hypothetical protein